MQLYKAKHFGSIPTFDLLNEDDLDIKNYCNEHREICDNYKKLKKFRFRDLIDTKYAPGLFESRILLPSILRRYLRNNDMGKMKYCFENFRILFTNEMGIYGILSYIIISLYNIFLFIIIGLTYKHRNHPYLKIISPSFCIFIIIGYMLKSLIILTYLPPYSEFKIKVSYIFESLTESFVYIPMILVTYRIYKIFKSNINIKSLTNKDLLKGFGIYILLIIIYKILIIKTSEFFYITFGYINETTRRFPFGYFDNYEILDKIFFIFYFILVSNFLINK